uniref:Uncharacterized protein n=1 Tax=Brassica oleracea var. oleracea TaxID=109376 RepID=A0A0D3DYI2_BRAOL
GHFESLWVLFADYAEAHLKLSELGFADA